MLDEKEVYKGLYDYSTNFVLNDLAKDYRTKKERFLDRGEFEIQIVDHCNLKCTGCNHFANLAPTWYMSIEEYAWSIRMLQEKVGKYIKKFKIVGGEPTLHPLLPVFIIEARQIFDKSVDIEILTNGINLNANLQAYLEPIINLDKVNYVITMYSCCQYKELQRAIDNNAEHLQLLKKRMFFEWPRINLLGDSDKLYNYSHCTHYVLPCFTIRNKKLYMCPQAATLDIFYNKFNGECPLQLGDYIPLEDLDEEKLFIFLEEGPLTSCQYCVQTDDRTYCWTNKVQNVVEDLTPLNLTPVERFKLDYKTYNLLYNGDEEIKGLKKDMEIDVDSSNDLIVRNLHRRQNRIDIIIPIGEAKAEYLDNVILGIKQQTVFEDCHIYVILDHSPDVELVFEKFSELNNVNFYSNEDRWASAGTARQIGLDNSYGEYVFFLDADDILGEKNCLEVLAKYLDDNPNYTLIGGTLVLNNTVTGEIRTTNLLRIDCSHGILYRRSFLIENNIRFKSYLINEDHDFIMQCMMKNGFQDKTLPINSYVYNASTETSLGRKYDLKALGIAELSCNTRIFYDYYESHKKIPPATGYFRDCITRTASLLERAKDQGEEDLLFIKTMTIISYAAIKFCVPSILDYYKQIKEWHLLPDDVIDTIIDIPLKEWYDLQNDIMNLIILPAIPVEISHSFMENLDLFDATKKI